MEVLKENIIIYECPVCNSIVKLTGNELQENYINKVAKCPVCNTNTWLFRIDGEQNPDVKIRRMTENEWNKEKNRKME